MATRKKTDAELDQESAVELIDNAEKEIRVDRGNNPKERYRAIARKALRLGGVTNPTEEAVQAVADFLDAIERRRIGVILEAVKRRLQRVRAYFTRNAQPHRPQVRRAATRRSVVPHWGRPNGSPTLEN